MSQAFVEDYQDLLMPLAEDPEAKTRSTSLTANKDLRHSC